jgi:hypothetical protein
LRRPRPLTEFEALGLARQLGPATTRRWLLTVDFEAFEQGSGRLWNEAMKLWAERAHREDIQFCFFMAVEDAVTLRSRDDGSFTAFGEGVKALAAAGSEFHPHNHCLFDPATGERPGLASGFPPRIPGYPKRPSMFYDVVHRHGVAFKEWLPVLVRSFDEILPDMAVTRPSALAFRAGGWDCGGTAEDLAEYVAALAASGFAYDSTASAGVFGTPSWRVGAPFSENVLAMEGLVEIAATDFVNCGLSRSITRWVGGALTTRSLSLPPRQGGVLVTVIHFDHLFHAGRGDDRQLFGVTDRDVLRDRIDAFFRALSLLRRLLGLECSSFGSSPLAGYPS